MDDDNDGITNCEDTCYANDTYTGTNQPTDDICPGGQKILP